MRVQIWALKQFGKVGLEHMISERPVLELTQLAWHVLKQKDLFNNDFDQFTDAVVDFKDRQNLQDAILATIGLSQPVIEGLVQQIEEEGKKTQALQTGASSTTESPASTS